MLIQTLDEYIHLSVARWSLKAVIFGIGCLIFNFENLYCRQHCWLVKLAAIYKTIPSFILLMEILATNVTFLCHFSIGVINKTVFDYTCDSLPWKRGRQNRLGSWKYMLREKDEWTTAFIVSHYLNVYLFDTWSIFFH